ncbi:MAG: aspartate kinase [Candidatus Zixiibacteriota bacterium]
MNLIVQKYGGTSVANTARIEAVADRIANCANKRNTSLIVVVSAMDKTTDELLDMAYQISEKPPGRELDMLLTAGERITMSLLSMALWKRGIKATSFTGSQSGIITDDLHNQARIIEVKAIRIIQEIQKGRIVIVAGFQGVSGKHEVTTLGRGGSDTTAVVLAHALGADRCEIYTDVDGVLAANPMVIQNPQKIEKLECEVLMDMAIFGTKVIHPRAIEIARRFRIPMYIKSSINDDIGTQIIPQDKTPLGGQKHMERSRIEGISSRYDVILIKGSIPETRFSGFIDSLRKSRISTMHPNFKLDDGDYKITIWIHHYDKDNFQAIADEFSLSMAENFGIIAVSGFELFSDLYILQELIETIASYTRIEYISSTSSSFYFFIEKVKIEDIIKKIHRKYIAR